MKKNFLKFILFYLLACVSWGKYAWDKIHESDSIVFKVIAFIFLLVSFYFLILGILGFFRKRKDSKTDGPA